MYKMTCAERVRFVYAAQAQEDPTMTLERARVAHARVCSKRCDVGRAAKAAGCGPAQTGSTPVRHPM